MIISSFSKIIGNNIMLIGRIINNQYQSIILYDREKIIQYAIQPTPGIVYMLNGHNLKIIDHNGTNYLVAQDHSYRAKILISDMVNNKITASVTLYKRRWFRKDKLVSVNLYHVII